MTTIQKKIGTVLETQMPTDVETAILSITQLMNKFLIKVKSVRHTRGGVFYAILPQNFSSMAIKRLTALQKGSEEIGNEEPITIVSTQNGEIAFRFNFLYLTTPV